MRALALPLLLLLSSCTPATRVAPVESATRAIADPATEIVLPPM